jgi:ABC-type dipeptide/oligopeptide/nickel transport system permease component
MGAYSFILRRLLQILVVLFGVSIIVFMILFLRGDPVQYLVPLDITPPETVEKIRHEMGFDDPLHIQYWRFVKGMVRGDFGDSYQLNEPALDLLLHRVPASLQLGVAALVISLVIGVPAGITAAVKRNTPADFVATWAGTIGRSLPYFWTGIMGILVFGVILRWLPTSGMGTWQHLVMPAITLGVGPAGTQLRLVRSSMLEVLGEDYIRTARAKGLSERVVIFKHALRNALIPVITMLGLQIAWIMGGSVVVETVFAWPGLGRLMVNSIFYLDMPVVQATVMFLALAITGMMLLVDIAYAFIDPRITYN